MTNTKKATDFQKSITDELTVVRNRVRNIIGNRNWGDEGRYKEAIFKNIIRRFLPSYLSVKTGFIVNSTNPDKLQITRQIDIIIYENTKPIIFSEGEFGIIPSSCVKGIVEVKTKISNSKLEAIINTSKSNGKIVGESVFNGIMSYEYDDSIRNNNIDNYLKSSCGYVNHISLGKNIFIKYWNKASGMSKKYRENIYSIYELRCLSFSYFISNLITMICKEADTDNWWLRFPVEGTKELHKIRQVSVVE